MNAADLNLLGKDYFDQAEAAHYCCLSLRQFQAVAASYGIVCVKFGGKLLYRRHDLQRAIENEWRVYESRSSRIPVSSKGSRSRPKRVLVMDGQQKTGRVRPDKDGKQDGIGPQGSVDARERANS